MDRAGLDAWVLIAREYNEDPVLVTMLPQTWLETARRRTILVFLRGEEGVERMAVARYAIDDLFAGMWDPGVQPDQLARLVEILAGANAQRVGVNTSAVFPLADGLSASEHAALVAAMGPLADRLVTAERAAIGWLETRLPEEIAGLETACAEAHQYLRRALSPEVIHPGDTTTEDVEWWLRQQVHDDGYGSWFHPTCSVQRVGGPPLSSFSGRPRSHVIEPGDLVHIDFGIKRMGLCTDQQQHGYVLKSGENEPPRGLAAGLEAANLLQDLLMERFVTGSTGNQILSETRRAATRAGVDGLVYTHPIGVHGHAAGPTIGLWDQQDGVSGQGDYPLFPDTAFSIELQTRLAVPEWGGQVVQFMLEEDAWFDGDLCRFLDGRQTELWLV